MNGIQRVRKIVPLSQPGEFAKISLTENADE